MPPVPVGTGLPGDSRPLFDPIDHPTLADGTSGQNALGIYWLVRDPSDPLSATLESSRNAAAASQGTLSLLSVRPYMQPQHLTLLGSAAGPNGTTDYTLRFTHPFAMPTNLLAPATATKRVDLFIFDVNLVLAVPGDDLFFGSDVRTNWSAFANADGYRQIGPLVNLSSLGVTNGTNAFPYRLLTKYQPSTPAGNYDAATGWTNDEYLNPTGYDVIPQGAVVETTVRIQDAFEDPLPVVVLAKYMDPRGGATSLAKRKNRLPTSTPQSLRYFLPEASGDLQRISAEVTGELNDASSSQIAGATAAVLDWDHQSTVAASFPNHSAITQIAEQSKISQPEASFPTLKAAGTFAGSIGATTGVVQEVTSVTFAINNIDKSFTADPAGTVAKGLMRLRDTQDTTSPVPTLLDEALQPSAPPSGFEASTRYQALSVMVRPGLAKPTITAVVPNSGTAGATILPVATNTGGAPTSWAWNFGGGATPNTSTVASPSIVLGAVGAYSASVTATNASGPSTFNFTLTVGVAQPNLTAVTPLAGVTATSKQFSATNTGGAPTSWAWNFGGGATPNTSSTASPTVTLGAIGTYNASVTATNATGPSTLNFTLDVTNAAPNITAVTPLSAVTATSRQFSATNSGGAATSWTWRFGGGATPDISTAASPTVTLGAVGTYSASVTATNATGPSTFNFTLTVTPVPPNLTAVTPLSGNTTQSKQFSATNTGGAATSWSWNFGGGASPNTSTAASPTVTLGSVGSYSASVTATNAGGPSTFNFTLTVNPAAPNLTGVSPITGTTGQSRQFAATNTGGTPTTWSWNFGGGASPNTSTSASPTVTLGSVGTYNATVTASNAGGPSTLNFTLTVNPVAPSLTAVTPLSGITGTSPTFGATNGGGTPTSWSWNFGGGATPNTSTAAAPSVTLGSVGTYNASVTATNAGGPSTFNFTLTVNPTAPNITAVTPTSGTTATSKTFAATNTGGTPTSWSWNFGGGASPNTSTVAGPTATLGSPGTYNASVTATNASGPSTFNFSLVVSAAGGVPVISAVSPLSPYSLRSATFSMTVTNTPTSWSWNFGGGATPDTSNVASPVVAMGVPGTYNGSVTATNASGTSAPFNFQYTVITKKVGLRLAVITSGGVYPKKLYGMSNWDLPGVQGWVASKINPVFRNAGMEIDINQITLVPTENPSLFNLDNATEESTLWSSVLGQNATKLNAYAVNSAPMQPNLGGKMTDTSCNQNNAGRGCYIITFNQAFDDVCLAHELGHVMNLPHIRTATPLNANNYNLMSYGTLSTALFTNGTREGSSSCIIWAGNPHNQFQVVNDWTWLNF